MLRRWVMAFPLRRLCDAPWCARLAAWLARYGRLALWLLPALPAVELGRAMRRYMVGFPFLDDFMFAPLYEKLAAHTVTLQDFWVVQMEHRLVVPRLILAAWFKLCPGRYDVQCWLTFALLGGLWANVAVLLRRACPEAGSRVALPLGLAAAAIFSPVHYQIVLWPMLFQVVLPAWGLSLGLVAVTSRWRLPVRFAVALLGTLAGMFSLASGLLAWVLLLPAMLWSETMPKDRRRTLFTGVWLATMLLTLALYFHNLHNTEDAAFSYRAAQGEDRLSGEIAQTWRDPVKVLRFMAMFAGGSLSHGTSGSMTGLATAVGAVALVLLGVALLVWWRLFRRSGGERMLPWLILGLYTAGTGGMVALGRSWASASGNNALNARYTIHAVPLIVALIALGWLWRQHLVTGERSRPSSRAAGALLAASGALTLWLGFEWMHGEAMMRTWQSSRLRGVATTRFFKLTPGVSLDGILSGTAAYAVRMDDMDLLPWPMLKTANLRQFDIASAPLEKIAGEFTSLWRLDDGSYRAEGYARLPGRSRVADGIILTRRSLRHPGIRTIVHVGQVQQLPFFLGESLGRDLRFINHRGEPLECEDLSGFDTRFHINPDSDGPVEIAVWALDVKRNTVHAIGAFHVDPVTGKIEGERGGGSLVRKKARQRGKTNRQAETP